MKKLDIKEPANGKKEKEVDAIMIDSKIEPIIIDNKQQNQNNQDKFKVLKKKDNKNKKRHAKRRKYPYIDKKIESIVESEDYEKFFASPQEIFGKTLSSCERNYWMRKILQYQMEQLGYYGIFDPVKYAERLKELIGQFYSKKQENTDLTEDELKICRKIQKAYAGLLQRLGNNRSSIKNSFPMLDEWIKNYRVSSEKTLSRYKTQEAANHNINFMMKRYEKKQNEKGFFVNKQTTFAEKNNYKNTLFFSDKKLLKNKRQIEHILLNDDNKDYSVKKNNPFNFKFDNSFDEDKSEIRSNDSFFNISNNQKLFDLNNGEKDNNIYSQK